MIREGGDNRVSYVEVRSEETGSNATRVYGQACIPEEFESQSGYSDDGDVCLQ